MKSKWIISFFLPLLITGYAYGALKEATWTEFKPPKKVREITYSGRVDLGYQSVEDVLSKKRQGISTNTFVNFTGPVGEEIDIEGDIQAKKQGSTMGNEETFGLCVGLKGRIWEMNLAGELSNLLDIVDKVEYESRTDSIKNKIRLSISEDMPLTFTYYRSSGKNLEGDSTVEETSTEEFNLLLESRFGRIQANLNLNFTETSDLVEGSKTRARSLGLNFILPLARLFQFDFRVQPSKTETIPEDEPEKVLSEQVDYTVGLTTRFFDRLRLITNFGLTNSLYKSRDTKVGADIFTQNYALSYQPLPVLFLNTNYNLSNTEDANKSQGATVNINYSPEESGFIGQTGLGFQTNRVEDNTGKTQSRNTTLTLNSLFNFTEVMNLGGSFTYSTQMAYSPTVPASSTTSGDLNLKFSHRPFKDLGYRLGYYFLSREDTEGDSRDTTNGYGGDISYILKIGKKELPICLSHAFIHSCSEEQKVDTRVIDTSIQVPITSLVSTSYSYRQDVAQKKTETESTLDKTTENTVGLKFRGKRKPFTLNVKFSLIDSKNAYTQSINTSFIYQASDE